MNKKDIKNKKNTNYFEKYIQWLQDKNFTKETIEKYLHTVNKCGNREINTSNIVDFLRQGLIKYQPNTLKGQRNALSSYAKFQKIYNEVDWEKINKVIPRIQLKLFPTITKEELEKLKQAKTKTDCKTNERNNIILDFLFYTGLRVNELINLKHSDYKNRLLKILGKGNKLRHVLLPPFLTEYFDPRLCSYLFLTRNGKKLTKGQIRRNIKRKAKQAGIKKNISPHTLRRSLATNLYNQGGKLETIQKQLGHASLDTTLSYIHNDYQTLYADYSKLWIPKK